MTKHEPLDIDVKRLRLQPGDAVVLKAHRRMTPDIADRLRADMGAALGAGTKVIVLDDSIDMAVLSPALASELEKAI